MPMPRAERSQVEGADAQDQHLRRDRDPHPPQDGRPHVVDIVRAQRIAEQAVVETVLKGKSRQECDQAESDERAVAQRSPKPSRCGGSVCKPALGPSGRRRSHGPSAGWA
jgi:hypothetical protein